MKTWISILRGINVGGRKKVPMSDLRQLYERMGFRNVASYIQSGNVVFSSDISDARELSAMIGKQLEREFGFSVPALLRSGNEMQQVIGRNPFLREKNTDINKLHVTFLYDFPGRDSLKEAEAYSYPPDRFAISGREVYVYCPDGYGKTKLNNTFFENKLKTTATTRNWKTVNQLMQMTGHV